MIQTIAAQGGFDPTVIIMWVAIGLIFWFFIIRPQKKRQKEIQSFRNSISVGSSVVTAGGIYGVVRAIGDDNVLSIEVAKGVNIRVDRNNVYATAQNEQTK